jgi:hypothetical protein
VVSTPQGLILSSPSNPTGALLTPEELRGLCEYCDREGVQFISDEIYHGISYGGREASALAYSDKVLVINSFRCVTPHATRWHDGHRIAPCTPQAAVVVVVWMDLGSVLCHLTKWLWRLYVWLQQVL